MGQIEGLVLFRVFGIGNTDISRRQDKTGVLLEAIVVILLYHVKAIFERMASVVRVRELDVGDVAIKADHLCEVLAEIDPAGGRNLANGGASD